MTVSSSSCRLVCCRLCIHPAGGVITHLFPQPAGPRLVLADDRMLVALYSPINDELIPLPEFEGTLHQVHLSMLDFTHVGSDLLVLLD